MWLAGPSRCSWGQLSSHWDLTCGFCHVQVLVLAWFSSTWPSLGVCSSSGTCSLRKGLGLPTSAGQWVVDRVSGGRLGALSLIRVLRGVCGWPVPTAPAAPQGKVPRLCPHPSHPGLPTVLFAHCHHGLMARAWMLYGEVCCAQGHTRLTCL